MKKRVHLLIYGRVQGVWFRTSTKNKAKQIGLMGWVKNTSDGYVEAVFEGEEEFIEEMIDWCHIGPKLANVTDVKIKYEKFMEDFLEFNIIY